MDEIKKSIEIFEDTKSELKKIKRDEKHRR